MKLEIRLHLEGLSLSNTVSELERFGHEREDVERCRSTVHNWVQKAGLQPTDGRSPDHIAVDETVIQVDDQRYWLYAAVDPDATEFLHVKLGTGQNLGVQSSSSVNYARNTASETSCFSLMAPHGSRKHSVATGSDSTT